MANFILLILLRVTSNLCYGKRNIVYPTFDETEVVGELNSYQYLI